MALYFNTPGVGYFNQTTYAKTGKEAFYNLRKNYYQLEFFPHKLHFMVESVTDRWVFRPRIEIEGALVPNGAYVIAIPDDEDFGQMKTHFWQHTKRTGMVDVYLDVAKLCSKHWIRCEGDFPYNLVSRPLAEKLLPLLPWACYLLPLKTLNSPIAATIIL
jgi:hypothetical protein